MNGAQVLSILQQKLGSADWSQWQIYRWQFYDYARLTSAGTNNVPLFVNPPGATDPVSALQKTVEQTNMPKSNSFGQVYYIIQQIRVHADVLTKDRQPTGISNLATLVSGGLTGMAAAFYNLLTEGVFLMSIGQKEYFDIVQPFRNAPPGFGLEIYQHASGTGGATAGGTRLVRQSNWSQDIYLVTPPQLIEPEQNIQVSIQFPKANSPAFTTTVNSATPNINIGVIFDGYIARPAQ